MDQRTIAACDNAAAAFAQDWHAQPAPTDLHAADPSGGGAAKRMTRGHADL